MVWRAREKSDAVRNGLWWYVWVNIWCWDPNLGVEGEGGVHRGEDVYAVY